MTNGEAWAALKDLPTAELTAVAQRGENGLEEEMARALLRRRLTDERMQRGKK